MTRNIRLWAQTVLIVAVPAWLLAATAPGQDPKGGAGAVKSTGGSGGGGSAPAPSGSSTASSGGSSSGGSYPGGGGSATPSAGGDRHAATGGSGVSLSRGGDRGSYGGGPRSGSTPRATAPSGASGSGNTASGATAFSGPTPPNASGGNSVGRAVPRGDSGATAPNAGGVGVPPYARPRGNEPVVGTAVPRGSVPGAGGPVVVTGGYGFYPWWIGGAGFGGYYGGYYGPGYGGYYDPWYGGNPDPYDAPAGASQSYQEEGAVRLKIKPREAEVYVDGYFVGTVDDFDGVFQRLHIETGPHRIEVRAPGYETLSFDLRVAPGKTTTYTGELKRLQ
jgi:hypothetical protein